MDAGRRAEHDAAAALAGEGWGGVYALVRGAAEIPAAASWRHKPRGHDLETVLADAGEAAVWQRQMVLGPAPELCVAAGGPRPAARVLCGLGTAMASRGGGRGTCRRARR